MSEYIRNLKSENVHYLGRIENLKGIIDSRDHDIRVYRNLLYQIHGELSLRGNEKRLLSIIESILIP